MLRLFHHPVFLLTLVATLLGPQAVLAEPAAPVEWSVQTNGDLLIIDAKTAAGEPGQRYNRSPDYLEVVFPKAKMASGPATESIDKGLIQKVQTLQAGEATMVRVYVVSKPKANLSKTAQGFRYTVRLRDLAGAPTAATSAPEAATTKPVEPPTNAAPVKPVATEPVKPVATQPVKPIATQPVKPVATQPVKPPVATPTSSSGDKRRAPVTAVFANKPLVESITELAQKAGYRAQIDPELSGTVNLSFSEIPFEDALSLLLEPLGDSVTLEIGTSMITVSRVAAIETTTGSNPATASGPIIFEYYPFSNKDAQKMMEAAKKAIPNLSYRVDPVLNILLVSGPREDVERLGQILKPMSQK